MLRQFNIAAFCAAIVSINPPLTKAAATSPEEQWERQFSNVLSISMDQCAEAFMNPEAVMAERQKNAPDEFQATKDMSYRVSHPHWESGLMQQTRIIIKEFHTYKKIECDASGNPTHTKPKTVVEVIRKAIEDRGALIRGGTTFDHRNHVHFVVDDFWKGIDATLTISMYSSRIFLHGERIILPSN